MFLLLVFAEAVTPEHRPAERLAWVAGLSGDALTASLASSTVAMNHREM
jgi:hypothetical protein